MCQLESQRSSQNQLFLDVSLHRRRITCEVQIHKEKTGYVFHSLKMKQNSSCQFPPHLAKRQRNRKISQIPRIHVCQNHIFWLDSQCFFSFMSMVAESINIQYLGFGSVLLLYLSPPDKYSTQKNLSRIKFKPVLIKIRRK